MMISLDMICVTVANVVDVFEEKKDDTQKTQLMALSLEVLFENVFWDGLK